MSNFPMLENLGTGTLTPEAIMMFEQFGRIGNSTDGQAFTRTREADEAQRIDVSGNDIYIGVAIPNTPESSNAWKIKLINTVNPISIKWADGSTLYNKSWTDRTTYTYL